MPTDKEVEYQHLPVLPEETIRLLSPLAGQTYVDATLGLGGHTELILSTFEDVQVIGIDQDAAAIEVARQRLAGFGGRARVFKANFSDIRTVLQDADSGNVDGILADLGVSSLQFDSPERGFSFRFDAPLDMRMDDEAEIPTAADLLATLSQFEIARIIYEYGEERFSRRIARRIVEKREQGAPIRTTLELAELVSKCIKRRPADKIHPATRTFQALRIAVNQELEILERFILDSADLLTKGGRLVLITFHSLEDRIVKRTFRKLAGYCFCPPRMPVCVCGGGEKQFEILTKRPLTAQSAEIAENPRSRSAKIRACRKIG